MKPNKGVFTNRGARTAAVLALTFLVSTPAQEPPLGAQPLPVRSSEIQALPGFNHPPQAYAYATRQTVIAPRKRAAVVLNGSHSFDPDGHELHILWLADGEALGQGKVITTLLAVGSHDIVLEVDDGLATNTHTIKVEVITPCDAIQQIATAIQVDARSSRHRPSLLASLRVACYFAKAGRGQVARDQLRAFQNKLPVLLEAYAPNLASECTRAAQDIRDALLSAIQFSAPRYVTFESDHALAVTVMRLGDLSTTITVPYRTARGTARPGLDYVAQRGTLVFPPLETSRTIYLPTVADDTPEGDESLRLILGHPSGGASLGETRETKVTIREPGSPIVWVLHDEDPDYGTPPFDDILQALNDEGNVLTTITGINICQTIGGWRAITAVDRGQAVLLSDFCLGTPMIKYDLAGRKVFQVDRRIDAADSGESGTIYALTGTGTIYGANLLKLSPKGRILAERSAGGVDLVADEQHGDIIVVGAGIKCLDPDLNFRWSIQPFHWAAVAVDVARDGSAWVAERQHSPGYGSNRLWHVSKEGQILRSVPLGFTPACVRVDPRHGGVYAAGGALVKYNEEGRPLFSIPFGASGHPVYAFSLAIDDSGNVWVGTTREVRKYSADGNLLLTTSRFARPSQTWVSISR